MKQFEDFYVTWYARLRRFAGEYVGDEEAEDVVQNVFTHLYEQQHLLKTCKNLKAYLFISIKNRCLDILARRVMIQESLASIQSERELELRMNFDSLEAFNIHFLEEDPISERLEQALSHLPEKCRIIFEMNKLEGKKQKQIAKDLHISIHTVESQMAIAYKKLRQEL